MKKLLLRAKGDSSIRIGIAVVSGFLLFFILSFFLSTGKVDRLQTEFERSTRKITLVQTMRSELLASAEAEKSAVMADTDEASKVFAEQSMQNADNVEKARVAFGELIKKNGIEANRLEAFNIAWGKLRETDQMILSLAVQNTNIKAFRLSTGPAAAAIWHMEEAMERLMAWAASKPNEAAILRFSYQAMTATLAVYALEAPHIAEATSEGMNQLENKISTLGTDAKSAFVQLEPQMTEEGKPLLEEIKKAFQDFMAIHTEIIEKSRENSNVRSFESSLGQKRNAMALCLDRLSALEETVRESATPKATR